MNFSGCCRKMYRECDVWKDETVKRARSFIKRITLIILCLHLCCGCSGVSSEEGITILREKLRADGEEEWVGEFDNSPVDLEETGEPAELNPLPQAGSDVKETGTESTGSTSETVSEEASTDATVFARGTVKYNTYRNASLGVAFEPEQIWDFYTDEKIAESNGLSYPLNDRQIEQFLKNDNAYVDMAAKHSGTTASVTVYQPKRIDGIDVMSDEELIRRTYDTALDENSPESLVLQLKKQGVSNPEVILVNVLVLGAEREAIQYSYSQNGRRFTGVKVLVMRGGYLVEIAARSNRSGEIDKTMNYFSFLMSE